MKRVSAPLVAIAAGAAVMLGTDPAHAHGIAQGGFLGGLSHPLTGLDHLTMLMAVGTAASVISSRLLLWALGGAFVGAAIGFTGWSAPSGEMLAALSISVVGAVILLASTVGQAVKQSTLTTISGGVVAVGISIHAMLHGLEAPKDSSTILWWMGALAMSVVICGSTVLILRKLPTSVSKAAAIAFLAIGGFLALGPLGLLAGGAGA
jgi:urease accessory protein